MRHARQPISDHGEIEGAVRILLLLPMTAIESLVENLICHLDALTGDPDSEDDDPVSCEAAEDYGSRAITLDHRGRSVSIGHRRRGA